MNSAQLNVDIQRIIESLDEGSIKEQLQEPLLRVGEMFTPKLVADKKVSLIYLFLLQYIGITPELMQTLDRLAQHFKLESLIEPYLQLSNDYLSSACSAFTTDQEQSSLKAFLTLLQGTYIFHRSIEELDDRVQQFISIPLTPFDMVNANLIAHEIIGDRFANRLDQIVLSLYQQSAFQQSKITKSMVEAQLNRSEIELFKREGKALSGEEVICFASKYDLKMSMAP